MNSHELQQRIRTGDRNAFRELYTVCGQRVYLRVQEALGNADAARDAVKQVFLNLHHEILSSERPLDIDARLLALTEAETCTRRLLSGDLSIVDSTFDATPSAPVEKPAPSAPVSPSAPDSETAQPATYAKPAVTPLQQAGTVAEKARSAPAPRPAVDPFETAEPYRPPLERAQAYMAADDASHSRRPRESRASKPHSSAVITVLIVIFLLIFLWVLAGILMDFRLLPRIDLGFRWFNETIFPLFKVGA